MRPFIRSSLFGYHCGSCGFSLNSVCRFIALCTEKTLEAYLWASQEYHGPPSGELEGEELPYNLLEHSLEQVNTQLTNLRGELWLDFNPLEERIISNDDERGEI